MRSFLFLMLSFIGLTANAVVINEEIFRDNGGDPNNVARDIKYHNEPLQNKSYDLPYLVVGSIPGCTATWLGNDRAGWTYVLTAAHCVPYQTEETIINTYFKSWDGKTIASGSGVAYVPSVRINIPQGMGGASTDIALLKLPTIDIPIDDNGHPLQRPVLYDGTQEYGRTVSFVGYGTWGVGLDQSDSYKPTQGDRRLKGNSTINSIFELDHGIGSTYAPKGTTRDWARVAGGDGGSSWWQHHNGVETIIATTNGGHSMLSTGARVSKYTSWIKSIYPDARLLNNVLLNWGNNDRKGTVGDYYIYNNPYSKKIDFFKLTKLGSDARYWYFPTDRKNNTYWTFVGPRTWGENDRKGVIGDIYLYDNPYSGYLEVFKLTGLGSDGRYWYFPTDKTNNEYWSYMGVFE
ncbi:MAG: trypsin-like serine protease [Plesiomonas sp.]